MGDRPHGLKDLFGSVPDEAADAPGAAPESSSGSARPSEPPRPAPPEGSHGLAGVFGAGGAPAPNTPSPADPPAAPVLDAPNLAPMPPAAASPPAQPAPAPTMGAMGAPALSCVVVARGGAGPAQRTIQALRLQTIADGLDVIVVADEPVAVSGAGFARLQALVAPGGASYGAMAAMGAEAAIGELVAILDDYAFPARDWAETVASHRHDPFAALGSALTNANPRAPMSWANMLLDHGAWREGLAGGQVDRLPPRNLVYRREGLMVLGAELPALLDSGQAAQRLAAHGAPLKLQDEARLAILNPSGKRATVQSRFAAGRLAAAEKAKGQGLPKRLGHAISAAFGGPARYVREKPRVFHGSDPTVNPRLQGRAVMIAMTAEGLGRAAGYLRGPGRAAQTRERMRAKRLDTLNKVDRKQFAR